MHTYMHLKALGICEVWNILYVIQHYWCQCIFELAFIARNSVSSRSVHLIWQSIIIFVDKYGTSKVNSINGVPI